MPEIRLGGTAYQAAPGETVLECIERHGVAIPSSCRSGICQTCLMRARAGEPGPAAQQGIADTLRAQHYFLSCVCRPEQDLDIELPDQASLRTRGRIIEKSFLNERIVRLRYALEAPLDYRAGQFMNLIGPRGEVRSYSLASVPGADDFLEFQILLLPGGRISTWVREQAKVGDTSDMLGPHGACFYLEGRPAQRLVLAGTGTGLAPLYGIARDALARGHTGPIHLYHGALKAPALYLANELRALAAAHPNFHYFPCVMNPDGAEADLLVGNLQEVLLHREGPLAGARVFLCGDPELVRGMQRECFKAGASLRDILADAFLPSQTRAASS